MWDLSLPRDQVLTPCFGRRSLNHWITRDVLPITYPFVSGFSAHIISVKLIYVMCTHGLFSLLKSCVPLYDHRTTAYLSSSQWAFELFPGYFEEDS